MYLVQNSEGLFFDSGLSRWVTSSGFCETPGWGPLKQAWITSCKEVAFEVARRYGGTVMLQGTEPPPSYNQERGASYQQILEAFGSPETALVALNEYCCLLENLIDNLGANEMRRETVMELLKYRNEKATPQE
jgi:hypothetical protein